MKTKGALVLPVDSTITEQRISHLSAYFHSETQLYSSYHAASYAVDVNVPTGYDLYPIEQFNDLLRSLYLPVTLSTPLLSAGSNHGTGKLFLGVWLLNRWVFHWLAIAICTPTVFAIYRLSWFSANLTTWPHNLTYNLQVFNCPFDINLVVHLAVYFDWGY